MKEQAKADEHLARAGAYAARAGRYGAPAFVAAAPPPPAVAAPAQPSPPSVPTATVVAYPIALGTAVPVAVPAAAPGVAPRYAVTSPHDVDEADATMAAHGILSVRKGAVVALVRGDVATGLPPPYASYVEVLHEGRVGKVSRFVLEPVV